MNHYKALQVKITIRPARIAVLLPADCEDWVQSCLAVIEQFSLIWGGGYNVLIPAKDGKVKPPFDDILTAFDPDYVVRYKRTWAQVERFSPEQFESEIRRREPHLNMAGQRLHGEEIDGLQVSKDVAKEWIERTGAFEQEVSIGCSSTAELFQIWGTFSIAAFVASGVFNDFVLPVADGSDWDKLFIASEFGTLPELFIDSLKNRFGARCEVLNFPHLLKETIEEVNAEIQKIKEQHPECDEKMAMMLLRSDDLLKGIEEEANTNGYDAASQLGLMSLMTSDVSRFTQNPIQRRLNKKLTNKKRKFPFVRCMFGLVDYEEHINIRRDIKQSQSSACVVGNSFEDFALYYCLNRLLPYPVKVEWQPNNQSEKTVLSVSLSCGLESIPSLLNEVRRVGERTCIRVPVTTWFERKNDRLISVSGFETPVPRSFPIEFVIDQKWITEIEISGFSAHHLFDPDKELLLPTDHRNKPRYRITSMGNIAYQCPYTSELRAGYRVPSVLIRPKVVCPSLLSMLRNVCQNKGMKVELSDKGAYLHRLLRRYGDIDTLHEKFVNNNLFCIMWGEVSKAHLKRKNNTVRHNDLEATIYYLSAQAISVFSDDALKVFAAKAELNPQEVRGRLEELLREEIIHRGIILKCDHCSATHWYRLDEVTDYFICKRCNARVLHLPAHYIPPPSDIKRTFLPIAYRMDEIVTKNLEQGNSEVIRALHSFKNSLGEPFIFTEPVTFSQDSKKQKCEVDFAFICRGCFGLGEASSSKKKKLLEKLKKKVDKQKEIMKALGGRFFCLHCKESFTVNEQNGIKESLKDIPKVEVLIN